MRWQLSSCVHFYCMLVAMTTFILTNDAWKRNGEKAYIWQWPPQVEYWDDVIQFPPIDETNRTPRSISESLGELISRLEANEERPGLCFSHYILASRAGMCSTCSDFCRVQ